MTLEYEHIPEMSDLVEQIAECEGRHTQQAVYSTFHGALTQVCYGCLKVRSTIYRHEQATPVARGVDTPTQNLTKHHH